MSGGDEEKKMATSAGYRKSLLGRMTSPFRSRPNRFFARLSEQAALTVSALQSLVMYMKEPSHENAKRIHQLEKEADEVRRMLIDELNRTFATPIDREDIFALSRAIDDVLDYADTTVIEMDVLSVAPTHYLTNMAALLADAAEEIHLAMERLQHHPGVANEHSMRAKALENRTEGMYREAIADLFRGLKGPEEIVEMLKLREVYRHMSNAADRGDEAANIISDIVVKMT